MPFPLSDASTTPKGSQEASWISRKESDEARHETDTTRDCGAEKKWDDPQSSHGNTVPEHTNSEKRHRDNAESCRRLHSVVQLSPTLIPLPNGWRVSAE